MLIDPSSDGHIHTSLCHHAVGEMEDYVRSAIEKGMREICFLEHMEEGVQYFQSTWLSEKDFDYYFKEGQRLQDRYGHCLTIGLGVEVGYSPQHRDRLLERLVKRSWDRIGVSYHFYHIDTAEDHLNLVSRKDSRIQRLTPDQKRRIEKKYYTTLMEAVDFLPGTVLCHLDAVLRYHPLAGSTEPPWQMIDQLLERMKANGVSLEINTSGLAVRDAFFPIQEIVRMAIAKEIPLVAGSDAHKPEDVGRHFSHLNTLVSQ